MRVFKTKWFVRFARREEISDKALREAVERAEHGLIDADLGGGLIKQRVAKRDTAKQPKGAALVLLNVIRRKGFEAIL